MAPSCREVCSALKLCFASQLTTCSSITEPLNSEQAPKAGQGDYLDSMRANIERLGSAFQ